MTPAELRAIVTEFYRRVFDDVMIGFMFAGKDRARLIQMEYELAANLLGVETIAYTGRPMRAAHAQHTIFGGQFERRKKILSDVLRDLHADPAIAKTWLDHTESLRSQVTRDRGSECSDPATPLIRQVPVIDPDKPIKLGRK